MYPLLATPLQTDPPPADLLVTNPPHPARIPGVAVKETGRTDPDPDLSP